MYCARCGKNLGDCACPDIQERLSKLRNAPNVIYKMCKLCGQHYARCKCPNPIWGLSNDKSDTN